MKRQAQKPVSEADSQPALLTRKEVAKLLQFSERTVYRKSLDGEIPQPIMFGRVPRWRRDILFSWLENDCQGV